MNKSQFMQSGFRAEIESWLRRDHWWGSEAALILSDVIPSSEIFEDLGVGERDLVRCETFTSRPGHAGNSLSYQVTGEGDALARISESHEEKIDLMRQRFEHGERTLMTPIEWIQWSIDKNFKINWLVCVFSLGFALEAKNRIDGCEHLTRRYLDSNYWGNNYKDDGHAALGRSGEGDVPPWLFQKKIDRVASIVSAGSPPVIIREWLRYDTWTVRDGLILLCGFRPFDIESTCRDLSRFNRVEIPVRNVVTLAGIDLFDAATKMVLTDGQAEDMAVGFFDRHSDIALIWESGQHDQPRYTPRYFVEWARQKRLAIDWLEWAISEKCYAEVEQPDGNREVGGKSLSSFRAIVGSLADLYWRTRYPDSPTPVIDTIISDLRPYEDYPGVKETNLKTQISAGLKIVQGK